MNKKKSQKNRSTLEVCPPLGERGLERGPGVRFKVCGMKYPKNILEVAELQPDYLGFIFYEKSPRNFEGIIPDIPKTIKKVGVFVNEYIEIVVSLTEEYQLDIIQLHGDETPEYIKELSCYLERSREVASRKKKKIEIIKAFGIKDKFDFNELTPYEKVVDYFLFDTKGEKRGGNGTKFNWEVLHNYNLSKPYFLSGGIGLEETDAVQSFLRRQESQKCFALDINSKFEIEAGLKSVEKIKKFKLAVITNKVK